MDSEQVKKKFFDVASPPSTPTAAPTVPSRHMIPISDPAVVAADPLLAPADASASHKPDVVIPLPPSLSKESEDTVAPLEEPVKQEPTDEPAVATESESISSTDSKQTAEPQASQLPTEQPTTTDDTPEKYAGINALPDPSELAAHDLKASMQEPKIYDTTAYHLPIKGAGRNNGLAKIVFLFIAIAVVVAAAAAAYFML